MPSSLAPQPVPSFLMPLPRWLTLGVPVMMLAYPFFLLIPALNWEKDLDREFGLMENLTALFLLSAFIVTLRALPHSIGKLHAVWLVLLALAAFVFFGEEISWGQHFFGWNTPENWSEVNRQHETNIHNMSGTIEWLFTKVLRNVLSTASIVGGLVIPWLYRRLKLSFATTNIQFWLWPSMGSALAGVLANTAGIPSKIANHYDAVLPSYLGLQVGEAKEAFLALFILLYAMVQYRVARQLKPGR